MSLKIEEMSDALVYEKVKIKLAFLGFNERYNAFEYLAYIITNMIISKSDSIKDFNEAIECIKNKYKIGKVAITSGINKICSCCKNEEIINKAQFKLTKNGIINKIRVIKNHILINFN